MPFVVRYPVAVAVLTIAFLATAGVFVFARPAYHRQYESKMIDFSKERHYDRGAVRAAFAAHGIELYAAEGPVRGSSWFANRPAPWPADALQVIVMPATGKGSFGPKLERYDERFGNVIVTYGGHDEELLDRVEATVDRLR
jgi:hypothetical protein